MLLDAFIFIVKTIIWAIFGSPEHKAFELVLVEIYRADIGIELVVIIVKITGFTVGFAWV